MINNPLLYYFGGKWAMANWIISFFPKHQYYVEVFGGGGSVLFKKPRSHKEVYNDINGEVVNLMRVVRDNWEPLEHKLKYTLWAREEFERALTDPPSDDPVERARRTIITSWMSRTNGGVEAHISGFRSPSCYSHLPQEKVFPKMVNHIHDYAERLRGVEIESMDAVKLISKHLDNPDVLLYVDPPYTHDSRKSNMRYKFEYTVEDHKKLLELLKTAKCSVVLSGYNNELYSEKLRDWHIEKQTVKTLSGKYNGEECLWMNYNLHNEWIL